MPAAPFATSQYNEFLYTSRNYGPPFFVHFCLMRNEYLDRVDQLRSTTYSSPLLLHALSIANISLKNYAVHYVHSIGLSYLTRVIKYMASYSRNTRRRDSTNIIIVSNYTEAPRPINYPVFYFLRPILFVYNLKFD